LDTSLNANDLGAHIGLVWIDYSIWLFKSGCLRTSSITLVWLFKSDQLSSSSINTDLIVQVRASQLVFNQHCFDCSSQVSQLSSSSLNNTFHVQTINASQLHEPDTDELYPSPRATVLKTNNQWEALDHNLMGFEWSKKGPLNNTLIHFNGYKGGHLDVWWDIFKTVKKTVYSSFTS